MDIRTDCPAGPEAPTERAAATALVGGRRVPRARRGEFVATTQRETAERAVSAGAGPAVAQRTVGTGPAMAYHGWVASAREAGQPAP